MAKVQASCHLAESEHELQRGERNQSAREDTIAAVWQIMLVIKKFGGEVKLLDRLRQAQERCHRPMRPVSDEVETMLRNDLKVLKNARVRPLERLEKSPSQDEFPRNETLGGPTRSSERPGRTPFLQFARFSPRMRRIVKPNRAGQIWGARGAHPRNNRALKRAGGQLVKDSRLRLVSDRRQDRGGPYVIVHPYGFIYKCVKKGRYTSESHCRTTCAPLAKRQSHSHHHHHHHQTAKSIKGLEPNKIK
ncbi:uncharacterized protein BDZ83DRAFT_246442 [Colletotrichum acutatum]|uniref:Uncharacterized protein n=1 Tax=Glomerella acutata TaxID=27357 RepID=A0AAD9D3C0_GLOAC|nr:uncharacterized protein BDZ83DRAFT_246442 [Colletotrichum acutatum]KAK1731336.1 hypothetical protein BDZ83DRAFT_246442 [Colletotrichum acutatum]